MKYQVFHSTCQGEGHLSSDKPCQDRSYSEGAEENGLCDILIVSDGHGSEEFYRSDRGAALSVRVAREAVLRFVRDFHPASIPSLVSRGIAGVDDCESEDFTPAADPNEAAFRQLASYILARWYEAVDDDWLGDPPLGDEVVGDGPAERAYGCTLQVAFRTERYWAALQLGDGKIVAFWPDGSWSLPVPWDSECFQNCTTSMCSHREDRFRYCYGSDQPMALFLGSDGMDDSFPLETDLARFYESVLLRMETEGVEKAFLELAEFLPELSRRGSQDDMSVALWLDGIGIPGFADAFRQREQEVIRDEIDHLREDISEGTAHLIEKLSKLTRLLSSYEMPRL